MKQVETHTKAPLSVVAFLNDSLCDRLANSLPSSTILTQAHWNDSGDPLAAAEGTIVFAPLKKADTILGPLGQDGAPPFDIDKTRRPPMIFLADDSPASEYFPLVARHNIRWFLHPAYMDDPRALSCAIDGALNGPRRGVLEALCPGGGRPRALEIDDRRGRREVIDQIIAEVDSTFVTDYRGAERRLALEEIINNAIFHAFESGGAPRYAPTRFERLREGDVVKVMCFIDETVFAFSVADNAGKLTGEATRRHIQRQLSGEGMLDVRGRGLFLTFSLANGLIVNTIPGELTEVAVVFWRNHPLAHKVFLINSDR